MGGVEEKGVQVRKALTAKELMLTRHGPAGSRKVRITAPHDCRRLEPHEKGVVLLALDVANVCADGAETEPVFRCITRRPKAYHLCTVPLRQDADEQELVERIKRSLSPVLQQLEDAHIATVAKTQPRRVHHRDREYKNSPGNRAVRKVGYAVR